jgi:hypothetical protein
MTISTRASGDSDSRSETAPPSKKCQPDAFNGICTTHHQPVEKCWSPPPSNSSNLEAWFLEQAGLNDSIVSEADISTVADDKFVILKAGQYKALLQSERQRWATELVEKLPLATSTPEELDKANEHLDSRNRAYWDAYNRGYCSLSDQVLTIIKESKT